MNSDPQKEIEQRLRGEAQRRRQEAGGPFELDTVSRRRLHQEVDRVYHSQTGTAPPRLRRVLWGFLAFSGTALLLIAVALALRSTHSPPQSNRTSLLSEGTPSLPPASKPLFSIGSAHPEKKSTARGVTNNARSGSKAWRTVSFRTPDEVPPRPRPENQPLLQTTNARFTALAMEKEQIGRSDAGEPPAAAAPRTLSFSARTPNEKFAGTTAQATKLPRQTVSAAKPSEASHSPPLLNQDFHQLATEFRRNPNAPPILRILDRFRFASSNNEVRIVDADGSVYSGTLHWAPEQQLRRLQQGNGLSHLVETSTLAVGATSVVASRRAARLIREGGFLFQASGTNRTFDRPVQLTGAWIPRTGAAGTPHGSPSALVGEPSAEPAGAISASGFHRLGVPSEIRAIVRIGRSNQVEFTAVPDSHSGK